MPISEKTTPAKSLGTTSHERLYDQQDILGLLFPKAGVRDAGKTPSATLSCSNCSLHVDEEYLDSRLLPPGPSHVTTAYLGLLVCCTPMHQEGIVLQKKHNIYFDTNENKLAPQALGSVSIAGFPLMPE